jgi:hypothetical protein
MDNALIYDMTALQMGRMLGALAVWLEKAEKLAVAKKVDPIDAFMDQRLIVDQYPLVEQIQSACDAAKFACARLTGKDAPKHPDTEKTFAEAKARVESVKTYLTSFKVEDFNGAAERKVTQTWMEGKYLRGADYLQALAVPNFYFHLNMAYAIMRANGVEIGKTDYIGELNWKAL